MYAIKWTDHFSDKFLGDLQVDAVEGHPAESCSKAPAAAEVEPIPTLRLRAATAPAIAEYPAKLTPCSEENNVLWVVRERLGSCQRPLRRLEGRIVDGCREALGALQHLYIDGRIVAAR